MIIMEEYRFEKTWNSRGNQLSSISKRSVSLIISPFLNPCLNSYFHRDS